MRRVDRRLLRAIESSSPPTLEANEFIGLWQLIGGVHARWERVAPAWPLTNSKQPSEVVQRTVAPVQLGHVRVGQVHVVLHHLAAGVPQDALQHAL